MKLIRIFPLFFLLVICSFSFADADTSPNQNPVSVDSAPGTNFAGDFKVDFAVPDSPAFNFVSIGSKDILRPTSVSDFSMVTSALDSSSFGLAFSPGMLFAGPKLSVSDYQKSSALYRLNLSLAVQRGKSDSDPTDIAVGISDNIIDEADLRNAKNVTSLYAMTDQINNVAAEAETAAPTSSVATPTAATQAQIDPSNKKLQAYYANKKWNAEILSIAAAAHFSSDQSSFSVENSAAWLTYANALFSNSDSFDGQYLLGFQLNDDNRPMESSVFGLNSGVRIYLGSNTFKGFIESQYHFQDNQSPDLLVNSGLEINAASGFWIVTQMKMDNLNGSDKTLTPSVNLNVSP